MCSSLMHDVLGKEAVVGPWGLSVQVPAFGHSLRPNVVNILHKSNIMVAQTLSPSRTRTLCPSPGTQNVNGDWATHSSNAIDSIGIPGCVLCVFCSIITDWL